MMPIYDYVFMKSENRLSPTSITDRKLLIITFVFKAYLLVLASIYLAYQLTTSFKTTLLFDPDMLVLVLSFIYDVILARCIIMAVSSEKPKPPRYRDAMKLIGKLGVYLLTMSITASFIAVILLGSITRHTACFELPVLRISILLVALLLTTGVFVPLMTIINTVVFGVAIWLNKHSLHRK